MVSIFGSEGNESRILVTFWVEGPFDLISKTGLSRCLLTCPHVAIAKSPAMTKSTVVLGSGGGSPSLEFLERPPAPEATTLWAWNSPSHNLSLLPAHSHSR